jgi:hypothetical protein
MQIRTLIVARTTETNRAEIEIESSQEKKRTTTGIPLKRASFSGEGCTNTVKIAD